MVLFRAFGQVDETQLASVCAGLTKIVADKNVGKCVNIGGITYYVRQLSEDEIKGIIDVQAISQSTDR